MARVPLSPSALAQFIFNDPSSWNSGVFTKEDTWDLLDQFPAVPQSGLPVSLATIESPDLALKPFTGRFRLEESGRGTTDLTMRWDGVVDSHVPSIVLNRSASSPGRNLFRALPSPLASPIASYGIPGGSALFCTPVSTPTWTMEHTVETPVSPEAKRPIRPLPAIPRANTRSLPRAPTKQHTL